MKRATSEFLWHKLSSHHVCVSLNLNRAALSQANVGKALERGRKSSSKLLIIDVTFIAHLIISQPVYLARL